MPNEYGFLNDPPSLPTTGGEPAGGAASMAAFQPGGEFYSDPTAGGPGGGPSIEALGKMYGVSDGYAVRSAWEGLRERMRLGARLYGSATPAHEGLRPDGGFTFEAYLASLLVSKYPHMRYVLNPPSMELAETAEYRDLAARHANLLSKIGEYYEALFAAYRDAQNAHERGVAELAEAMARGVPPEELSMPARSETFDEVVAEQDRRARICAMALVKLQDEAARLFERVSPKALAAAQAAKAKLDAEYKAVDAEASALEAKARELRAGVTGRRNQAAAEVAYWSHVNSVKLGPDPVRVNELIAEFADAPAAPASKKSNKVATINADNVPAGM